MGRVLLQQISAHEADLVEPELCELPRSMPELGAQWNLLHTPSLSNVLDNTMLHQDSVLSTRLLPSDSRSLTASVVTSCQQYTSLRTRSVPELNMTPQSMYRLSASSFGSPPPALAFQRDPIAWHRSPPPAAALPILMSPPADNRAIQTISLEDEIALLIQSADSLAYV